jgi:hypothetical protein
MFSAAELIFPAKPRSNTLLLARNSGAPSGFAFARSLYFAAHFREMETMQGTLC